MRDAARASYVHERLPLTAVADRHGIAYDTVRRWKQQARERGDDWDRARTAARLAAGGLGDITTRIIEDFAFLFEAEVGRLKSDEAMTPGERAELMARVADAYAKMMRAAGAADAKIGKLAVALQVLEELAKFIREQFADDLPRFAAILEPFGARVAEVFG